MNIDMEEPTDPFERQSAIRICRANAGLSIDTGLPLPGGLAERMKQWDAVSDELPYKKWIWMWNHGQAEWDYSTHQSGGSP
jgi:hypothetical protein